MIDKDFACQLKGYNLTTAEILYHMPDYPDLLQTYIWQDLDLSPQFPKLASFLKFWQKNLAGGLHTVRVASSSLISPREFQFIDGQFTLN